MSELIPCEICNENIEFSQYESHTREHERVQTRIEELNTLLNDPLTIRFIMSQLSRSLQLQQPQSAQQPPPPQQPPQSPGQQQPQSAEQQPPPQQPPQSAEQQPQLSQLPPAFQQLFQQLRPPQQSTSASGQSHELEYESLPLPRRLSYRNMIRMPTHIFFYDTMPLLSDDLEDIKIGIKDIEKYSKVTQCDKDFHCVICMEDYSKKDKIDIRTMDCGHEYCLKCSVNWFKDNKKCPICNKEFDYYDEKSTEDDQQLDSEDDSQSDDEDYSDMSELIACDETISKNQSESIEEID